jgi:hypothetical protein
VADAIRATHDLDVLVARGWPGEFTVRLDGQVLARRRWLQLPTENAVLAAVGRVLRPGSRDTL